VIKVRARSRPGRLVAAAAAACAVAGLGVSGPDRTGVGVADEGADAMAARIVQFVPGGETSLRGVSRSFALLASALVLCAVGGLAGCARHQASSAAQASSEAPGGPFNLVDQDGRPVDQTVLNGKWNVVFFGYTFCPDFCPTTLTTLGQAMQALGPKADDVRVVFISVDPDRDTPKELKTYLSAKVFPKNIIGLTGTPAQVAKVAKEYVVYYQKDGTGPNYTVDHSTAIYLMDPQGHFRAVIADGLTPQEEARQISAAMSGA
jgi:protein SCO1/2